MGYGISYIVDVWWSIKESLISRNTKSATAGSRKIEKANQEKIGEFEGSYRTWKNF